MFCASVGRGLITLHGCNSSPLIPSALGKRPVLLDKLITVSCALRAPPELFTGAIVATGYARPAVRPGGLPLGFRAPRSGVSL